MSKNRVIFWHFYICSYAFAKESIRGQSDTLHQIQHCAQTSLYSKNVIFLGQFQLFLVLFCRWVKLKQWYFGIFVYVLILLLKNQLIFLFVFNFPVNDAQRLAPVAALQNRSTEVINYLFILRHGTGSMLRWI